MAETKHTPGEWKAGKPAPFKGRHSPEAGKIPITVGSKGVIANVYGIANAALIAAAPTLQAKIDRLEAEKAELVKFVKEIASQECCESPGCGIEKPFCDPMAARVLLAKHKPKPRKV